jgi:hypothetical protein
MRDRRAGDQLGDFVGEARAAFAFLERGRGFRVAHSQMSPSFGDAVVDFASPTLLIRLLRDRGQVFLDVAPAGGGPDAGGPHWFDLPLLLEYLGAQDHATALVAGGQRDIGEVARILQAHFDEIAGVLGGPRAAEVLPRLAQLRQTRADARYGGTDR